MPDPDFIGIAQAGFSLSTAIDRLIGISPLNIKEKG